MEIIACFILLSIISIVITSKEEIKPQNALAFISTLITGAVATIIQLAVSIIAKTSYAWLDFVLVLLASIVAIICKLKAKDFDEIDLHTSKLSKFISKFYSYERKNYYLKNEYRNLNIFCFLVYTSGLVLCAVITIMATKQAEFELPTTAFCALLVVLELGLFLSGKTKLYYEKEDFEALDSAKSEREYLRRRFRHSDNYLKLFKRNLHLEKKHIIEATIQNYVDSSDEKISQYNFKTNSIDKYTMPADIAALGNFLDDNGLNRNDFYIKSYDLLSRGENVLLKTPSYKDFEPYLISIINTKVSLSKKVVIITDGDDGLERIINNFNSAFVEYYGIDNIPLFQTLADYNKSLDIAKKLCTESDYEQISQKVLKPRDAEDVEFPILGDVILATNESICDKRNIRAIREIAPQLDLIVYYDFSECLNEDTLLSKIAHSILDKNDNIATLFVTDGFFDVKQSIKNFFSKRDLYETVVPRKKPSKSYDIIWRYENFEEYQEREITDPSVDFGMNLVLCQDALRYTKNDAVIINDESDPYSDQLASYAVDTDNKSINCYVGWKEAVGGEHVFCSVTDRYNNIAHTYLSVRGIGESTEYINIVSKPYLLREYLAHNLKHFETKPDTLTTLSSSSISNRAIAVEAITKGYIVGLTLNQIKTYAKEIGIDEENNADRLIDKIACVALNSNLVDYSVSCIENIYYVDEKLYDAIMELTEFTKTVTFKTRKDEFERYARKYKYITPEQKLVFNGRKFTVNSFKNANSVVNISDTKDREPVYGTRIVRTCSFDNITEQKQKETYQNNRRAFIESSRLTCDVTVNNRCKISFKDAYSFDETMAMNNYETAEFTNSTPDTYKSTNVLKIKLRSDEYINSDNKAALAHTLALLLSESMLTFFPKHSERIIVGCSDFKAKDYEKASLKNVVAMIDDPSIELNDNEICLYILEDSAIETGIINVFGQDEEFRYVLKILEDYLYFIENIDRRVARHMFGDNADTGKTLHILRKLLLYAIDEPTANDQSIKQINSIRRTRATFNKKELMNTFRLHCDYCGKEIVSTDGDNQYHYLGYSGLVCCPKCYTTSVCTEKYNIMNSQFRSLNHSVKSWVERKYNQYIFGPSIITLEDPAYISAQADKENDFFISDDSDSVFVLGYAMAGTRRVIKTSMRDLERMPRIGDTEDENEWEDWKRVGYFVEDGFGTYENEPEPVTEYIDGDNSAAAQRGIKRRINQYEAFAQRYDLYEFEKNSISSIFITNGLRKEDYRLTLAHELTHQWQFENLDIDFMMSNLPGSVAKDDYDEAVDVKNFRLEGHAVYVELRYALAHRNFKFFFKRLNSLMHGTDEYSIGFKWMLNMMRIGGFDSYNKYEKHEFRWKILRTWYQFIKNPFKLMELYYGVYTPAPEATSDEELEELDNNYNID